MTRTTSRRAALALSCALFVGATTVLGTAASATPTASYFAPAPAGSDANPCTQALPCATLAKANSLPLEAGSRLYFRRGGTWTGTLTVSRSGSSGNDIIVGSYGDTTKPQPLVTGAVDCIRVTGNWVTIDNVEASGCSWAGVRVSGQRVTVKHVTAASNVVGIMMTPTATAGRYLYNKVRDNNRMSKNTPSPANDDSGAFGFLVQGDGNELAYNQISGSDAFSYDYGRDGCAIEIYGASGTKAHDNVAVDNNCFVELGRPPERAARDNAFQNNRISSYQSGTERLAAGSEASALITRGPNDWFGPVERTTFSGNTVTLTGHGRVSGLVCYAGCTSSTLTLRNNTVQVGGSGSSTGWVDKGFANSDGNTFSPAYPTNLVPGPSDRVV